MIVDEKEMDEARFLRDRTTNPRGSYPAETEAVAAALKLGEVVGLSNLYRGSNLTDIGLYLAFDDAIKDGLAGGLSPYDYRVGNHNTIVLIPIDKCETEETPKEKAERVDIEFWNFVVGI